MAELIIHTFIHTISDTLKTLPFLFLAYLLIEFIEHRKSDSLELFLSKMGKFGFLGGALLGCIPQCGFSVASANLYAGRVIRTSTLIAVFIATSDEAIPVLLANPNGYALVFKLIITKLIIAVVAGIIIELFSIKKDNDNHHEDIHEKVCSHCGCEKHGILYATISHTLSIFAFLVLISFAINFVIELVGEDTLASLLFADSFIQPAIAALIGIIPNCASSVLLTELFLAGTISFGSAVSGLCVGAGVGFLVLFRVNKNTSENFIILLTILMTGILSGILLQILGF